MVNVVRVQLPSHSPVVGCELFPFVLLKLADDTASYDDIPESSPVEGHFLRYKWYRLESTKKTPICSIHPFKKATTECIGCKGIVPVETSYHCSSKCYTDAWPHHRTIHENAAKAAKAGGASTSSSAPQPIAIPSHPGANNNEVWVEVGSSKTYAPTAFDVTHILKFECHLMDAKTKTCVAPPSTLQTSRVIPAPCATPRRLISVCNLDGSGQFGNDVRISSAGLFTVLSYNLLADSSVTNELYGYCPSWALTWLYRRHNLLQEIIGYQADVVCLQEVQNNHFYEYFGPELEKHGYHMLYMRKTTEVPNEGVATIHGCATFFRRDKFSLIKKYGVEFNKGAKAFSDTLVANLKKRQALERLANDNVALITILETKFGIHSEDGPGKGQLVCVANTHVDIPEDLKDAKIWQVCTMIKGLETVGVSKGIPIILCGDFSSTPGSALHELLLNGRVNPSHPDLVFDPLGVLEPARDLTHTAPMVSVYSLLAKLEAQPGYHKKKRCNPATSEPLFTYCTKDFSATIDYIFFSEDGLEVESVLELLDEEWLRKETALPSSKWSSDHIALLAGFRCKPSPIRF